MAVAEPPDWDTIVVGAGIGGLVCAGYLAAAGQRVLVLEQHDVAGGNAHVFRRRRAYEFDVGVHYLGDCGPEGMLPAILNGLALGDRIRLLPMDFQGFDRIVLPSRTIDVPVGWAAYRDRLCSALPAERTGITACIAVFEAIGEIMRATLLSPGEVAQLTRDHPGALVWSRRPLTQLFAAHRLSPLARTVLAAQAGNYGASPDGVTVATHASVLDHYLRGAYHLDGGGQTLVAALVELVEAHGGQVRTRACVRTVHTDGGVVSGVTLDDDERIHASTVVSNADFRRTVLELCSDTDGFPVEVVERTRAAVMRHAWAILYLGLSTQPPGIGSANLWCFDHEDIEGAYRRFAAGDERLPFVFVSCASARPARRPWACPPGQGSVQVMAPCAAGPPQWNSDGRYRRDPRYRSRKRRLTNALLAAAERAVGPLGGDIVHLEVATPSSHQRYTRSTDGTPYGLADWGGIARRPDTATPVTGLHVVGQSTRYGSGVTGAAVSGICCAGEILGRELLRDVYAGTVLADPARLPHRTTDWDPLAVSRGEQRRGAPGLPKVPLVRPKHAVS
ncbi:phytoene desaturase family protein [Nocardia sp. NPDC051321]|uniref:phytoene desaturase family protein n=1 Tax=Nocardia sp. NPDC051321 TaxID=3364323 RepID=UPI0037A2BC4B